MNRLRSLLAAAGIVVIGGTSYLIAIPRQGVTRSDLADAGISEHCDPVTVTCAGRDLCRSTTADGGLSSRYRTLRMLGYQCDRDAGEPVLILRAAPAVTDCFEALSDDSCQVLGATVDDGGTGVQAEPDRCACRARGQVCRISDGGLMSFDQTYPAPFLGAGCRRKACTEAAGEQGQSMPEVCL